MNGKFIDPLIEQKRDSVQITPYSMQQNYENIGFKKHMFKRDKHDIFVQAVDYIDLANDADNFIQAMAKLQKSNDINLCFDCSEGIFDKKHFNAVNQIVDKIEKYNDSVKDKNKLSFNFTERVNSSMHRRYDYGTFKEANENVYKYLNAVEKRQYSPLEALLSLYINTTSKTPWSMHYRRVDNALDGISPYATLIKEEVKPAGYAKELDQYVKILNNPNLKIFNGLYSSASVSMVYLKDEKYGVDGFYLMVPAKDSRKDNFPSVSSFLISVDDLQNYNDEEYSSCKFIKESKALSDFVDNNFKFDYTHSKPIEASTIKKALKAVENPNMASMILYSTYKTSINQFDLLKTNKGIAKEYIDTAIKSNPEVKKEFEKAKKKAALEEEFEKQKAQILKDRKEKDSKLEYDDEDISTIE